MKNWKTEKIAIKDLWLWDENPRFPQEYFSKTEEELIDYFLKRKDLKIPEFTKEVIKDFDLPQLENLVVLEFNGKKIVLEGNRRLVAYKLLANPKFIKGDNGLSKQFEELGKSKKITDLFMLKANVTLDKEEGLRYVDRKHNKNNNEIGWGEPERRHFAIRRSNGGMRDIIRVALANAVKNISLPTPVKDAVLGKGYVTTFYRITDSAAARTKLGYEPKEDGTLKVKDRNKFDNLLKVIAHNVWAKKDFHGKAIDSRSLNKIEAINEYIDRLDAVEVKQVDEDVKKRTDINLFGSKVLVSGGQTKSRRTPITKDSDEIFGKMLLLESGKVNDLYRALVEIDNKCKNSEAALPFIGMALRLLVEVAARVYYESQGNKQTASKDQVCEIFLKEAKKTLQQQQKNAISLTGEWLSDKLNLSAILNKYAHGSIIYKRTDVLKNSIIIADILEFYFKRKAI